MDCFSFDKNATSEYWTAYIEQQLLSDTIPLWKKDLYLFLKEWFSSSETVVVHTSGSTGEPKRIEVSKRMMRVSAHKTLRYFQLHPSASALLCLSVNYIAGKMMVVRAIEGGLRLYVTEPTSLPLLAIERPIDFVAMVPLQVYVQLKESGSLSKAKRLLIGGGAVDEAMSNALEAYPACAAYESYGMTETVSHIALRRINGPIRQQGFYPMEGVHISIDSRNCVRIDALDLLSFPLQTNDCAEMYADGSFRIIGRVDNVINTGGIKVQPEEMERAIASIFPKEECVVSFVSDERLGQALVLVSDRLFTEEEMARINALFSSYKKIRRCCVLPFLPRTATQKIDRQAIISAVKEHFE